jgi:hypothetical protein
LAVFGGSSFGGSYYGGGAMTLPAKLPVLRWGEAGWGEAVWGAPDAPLPVTQQAVANAIAIIAGATYLLEQLHAPEPLIGGLLVWLLALRLTP